MNKTIIKQKTKSFLFQAIRRLHIGKKYVEVGFYRENPLKIEMQKKKTEFPAFCNLRTNWKKNEKKQSIFSIRVLLVVESFILISL